MTSIDIDAEQLRSAAETLRGVADEAGSLADYAKEADPDLWMWGLGGLPFAAVYFAGMNGFVHPTFEETRTAIDGLASALDKCAEDHEGNDDEIAAELSRIADRIDSGDL